MGNDLVQAPEPLKPYYKKERPKCPFYGFNGVSGIFFDTEGNQCGAKTSSHAPCQMEINRDTPNWSKCLFNTERHRRDLRKILDNRIFPKEFQPPGAKSWEGITLKQWIQYLDTQYELFL